MIIKGKNGSTLQGGTVFQNGSRVHFFLSDGILFCKQQRTAFPNERIIRTVDEGMCMIGSTVALYDGLQIAVTMGELCADIYKVCQKGESLTQ